MPFSVYKTQFIEFNYCIEICNDSFEIAHCIESNGKHSEEQIKLELELEQQCKRNWVKV